MEFWTKTFFLTDIEIDHEAQKMTGKPNYILLNIKAGSEQEVSYKIELAISSYCENILKSVYQILEIDCRRIH